MAIVLANGRKAALLQNEVTYLGGLTYHLYANNVTPTGANVVGDFTEATFSGYAASASPVFGSAYLNGSNQGETDAPMITFTCTGSSPSNSIYGYYVTDGGGALVFSERYAGAPVTINTAGQAYLVTPQVLLDTL